MSRKKYSDCWLVFVNLKARDGYIFNDLIDLSDSTSDMNYKGAWANIIVKADTINEALEIVPLGLEELDFEIVFIDKVENIASLVEYKEVSDDVLLEVDWLLRSKYVFKISDKLFPYK